MRNAWQLLLVRVLVLWPWPRPRLGQEACVVPMRMSFRILGLISRRSAAYQMPGNLNVPSRGEEGSGREGSEVWVLSKEEPRANGPSSIWHLFIHALHIRIRRDKTLQISQPEDVAQCRISDSQSAPKQQQQQQQQRTGQATSLRSLFLPPWWVCRGRRQSEQTAG